MSSFWTTTPQVTLQKPAPAKVSEAADAINDEKLVDTALHMFRGGGDGDGDAGVSAKASTAVLKVVKTDVVGVAKGPTNHLVRKSRREIKGQRGKEKIVGSLFALSCVCMFSAGCEMNACHAFYLAE